jgi:hypothetical protein
VIAEHLETFLASLHDDPDAKGLPAYVVVIPTLRKYSIIAIYQTCTFLG